MPPQPPRLPIGYFLCGMMSMLFAVVMLLALLIIELDGDRSGFGVALRGSFVLLASLAMITTEALWKARREAYPASVALAVCFAVWLLGITAVEDDLLGGFLLLSISSLVVGPMLRYLHVRSRKLWPRTGVRVPAPRP